MGKYKPGEPEDFSAERVKRSVHESLERLQLKYLDLVHCHDIESAVEMKKVWCFHHHHNVKAFSICDFRFLLQVSVFRCMHLVS